MARNYFLVREAAELLGVSTQWVTRKIHVGEIKASRLGTGWWRIPRRALISYADNQGIELNHQALALPKPRPQAEYAENQPQYAQTETVT